MKILFITDLYPVKENEKTTPRTLFTFVHEWRKAGHTVDIIKPNFILNSFLRGKPFYKTDCYFEQFRDSSICRPQNDNCEKLQKLININYWTPFWFDVKKKLKKFNIDFVSYDIIIAHMPSGILFADKLNIPFVAGVHNSDLEILTKPLYKLRFAKREERALQNAKKIACRSYVIKDKLTKLFPEFEDKTFVAPSGVNIIENGKLIIDNYKDNKIFNSQFSILHSKNSTLVLTCAHLKKRKNIDKVIQACKGLDDIKLTVAGDGRLRKSLEKLDKSVNFTGYLEHDKVLDLMKQSDIFILPSVGETFGMVYLEAMASGCITICTENDGISGIIKDGFNGFLVQPDVESIRELIIKIQNTDNETLDMIRQNAFKTVKELNPSKCAEDYLQQIFKIS